MGGCKSLKLVGRNLRLRTLASLRVVDLSECRRLSDDCIRELPAGVVKLVLQDCDRITDGSLEHMAANWAGLTTLDVSSCRMVRVLALTFCVS